MIDLKNTLEPYSQDINLSAQSELRRKWNATVSITERSNIEQKIQRVLMLNHEVSRALQVIQLEMQKTMAIRLERASSSAQSERQALVSPADHLKSLSQNIQHDTNDTNLNLAQLQLQVASSKARVDEIGSHIKDVTLAVKSADDTTKRLQADSAASSNSLHVDQIQLRDTVDATRIECQRIGNEVQQLRDHILLWIIGSRMEFSTYEPIMSLLSSADSSDLRVELARKLAESPSGFRKACDNTLYGLQTTKETRLRRDRRAQNSCVCKLVLNRLIARRGRLNFVFESDAEHFPERICYLRQKKKWRYTLSAHLLPLLRRTLDITITITSGAGGCSIGVFLNYYRTVRRSESELYRLFDHFPENLIQRRCAKPIPLVQEGRIVFLKTSGLNYHSELVTIGDSAGEIDGLARSFIELLHRGYGWDKDEYGNTVLHELVHLALYLGSAPSKGYAQLQSLIEMVLAAGVDILGSSKCGIYRPYIAYNIWIGDVCTVPQIIANCAVEFPDVFDRIPFYDAIGDYSFNEAGNIYKDLFDGCIYYVLAVFKTPLGRDVLRHQRILRVLRHHLDLTILFGYGPFESSILSRSQDYMLQIFKHNGTLNRDYKGSGLYPLDFALGWPDGWNMLLEAGYKAETTLELSISIGDLESTMILLEAKGFSLAEHPSILVIASQSDSLDVQRAIIGALKKCRENLRNIALENLFDKETDGQGLLQESVSDSRAIKVWNELLKRGIPVPKELHPGHFPTIFALVRSICRVEFLDALYDAGFEFVDGEHKSIGTPLLEMLRSKAWEYSNGLNLVRWFINKQANLNFTTDDSFPTILFYFAIVFLKELAPLATSFCDPLRTDGCSCYCSSLKGCLPPHKLWICNPQMKDHKGCMSITKALLNSSLEKWVQLCRLDRAQTTLYYNEMSRVEIFDRLGMAHTCCTYSDRPRISKETMEEVQQGQLRDEDSQLSGQLNLIMEAYEQLRKEYTGNFPDFWAHWWVQVDEILPELSPEERCRCKGLDRLGKDFHTSIRERVKFLSEYRAKVEENALKANGYYGMQFVDVIRLHFADCLSQKL
ncbi:hypothetical protein CC78DRAFT_542831 [Lojkania enalia]|uniref:Uncharacterized protein n=1 Tax=Lojkania enalia TaxID=147567 RepID=A0A9P4N8R2_9PLEO|nr:hypothetical protein CC78DRAFT_542831 [Didymosphaeria enalia]